MIKNVVILDANNVISNGGLDVLKRHMDYARELEKQSTGSTKLVIIGNDTLIKNYSKISVSDSDALVLISVGEERFTKLFFWKYAWTSLKKKKIDVSLLVSGDPWVSGLNSVILKIILSKSRKVLLQIQLHADIFCKGWKSISFRNYLKFLIARFVINRSDAVRTVSHHQTINLAPYIKRNLEVACIPVSLSLEPRILMHARSNLLTFGFLGRLHKDRGTELLISLFSKVLTKHRAVHLFIAGDGPEESKVRRKLLLKFPNQVEMMGHIVSDKLIEFWNNIDVLVSLAKFESYGRAPRESIAMQIPVIALESSGIMDLAESNNGDWVSLINENISDDLFVEKAISILEKSQEFAKPDINSLRVSTANKLSENWLMLLDRD